MREVEITEFFLEAKAGCPVQQRMLYHITSRKQEPCPLPNPFCSDSNGSSHDSQLASV